jgi:hypothetical protein
LTRGTKTLQIQQKKVSREYLPEKSASQNWKSNALLSKVIRKLISRKRRTFTEQHTFLGSAEAEFSNCNVKKLNKCVVAEPIVAKGTFEGVEGPKGEENAMGVEYKGAGGGETFTEIEFKNKGAEACSVNGQKFAVKGSVIGTSGPTTESAQGNKEAGATIVFSQAGMQKLQLGTKAAQMSLIVVPTMASGGYPISITTTT